MQCLGGVSTDMHPGQAFRKFLSSHFPIKFSHAFDEGASELVIRLVLTRPLYFSSGLQAKISESTEVFG